MQQKCWRIDYKIILLVMNISSRNLTGSEISLLSKGLNFVPASNTIEKAKLKTELQALGRILKLKRHFRNEENEFNLDQFKPKPIFNPRNKDVAIEVYMSSLEEKLMKLRYQRTNITLLLVKNDKLYTI